MLRELHIENVAVIERADLELGPGLNILTGETGAGKSILVDAMHAILGARASRELVRTGAEKAVVCATFDPDPCRDWCEENEIECDDELIIRRQITAEGKTSCRVCGVPVTTAQLRTLGALLLDIHGQNDGQHLLDEREHLRNLDRFGQLEPELARYREQYQAYQALCKERDTLSTYENEKELLTESLRRQIEELERAELKAGEEAELTERSDLLRNFEKLLEAVDQAYDLLAGRDDSAAARVCSACFWIIDSSFCSRSPAYLIWSSRVRAASSVSISPASSVLYFRSRRRSSDRRVSMRSNSSSEKSSPSRKSRSVSAASCSVKTAPLTASGKGASSPA